MNYKVIKAIELQSEVRVYYPVELHNGTSRKYARKYGYVWG